MKIQYTLTGYIDVPAGSELTKSPRGIVLPNGNLLKLWEVVELNEIHDLNSQQLEEQGCYLTYESAEMEIVDG